LASHECAAVGAGDCAARRVVEVVLEVEVPEERAPDGNPATTPATRDAPTTEPASNFFLSSMRTPSMAIVGKAGRRCEEPVKTRDYPGSERKGF
jgi:hypothetical protein